MAEAHLARGGAFVLVENHCPTYAAATACPRFCYAELELFQTVLGPDVKVGRTEHIVAAARRCACQITSSAPKSRQKSGGRPRRAR